LDWRLSQSVNPSFFAMKTSIINRFRQTVLTKTAKTCTVMLTALTMLCSCIYDAPKGDDFYRTLWTSEEFPYGQITLEFLCDNYVSIQGVQAVGSYGHYEVASGTAVFKSLELMYDTGEKVKITIDQAYRNGDTMQIIWHTTKSSHSSTTTMTRLSSYK
jgi:hypothetical protein